MQNLATLKLKVYQSTQVSLKQLEKSWAMEVYRLVVLIWQGVCVFVAATGTRGREGGLLSQVNPAGLTGSHAGLRREKLKARDCFVLRVLFLLGDCCCSSCGPKKMSSSCVSHEMTLSVLLCGTDPASSSATWSSKSFTVSCTTQCIAWGAISAKCNGRLQAGSNLHFWSGFTQLHSKPELPR